MVTRGAMPPASGCDVTQSVMRLPDKRPKLHVCEQLLQSKSAWCAAKLPTTPFCRFRKIWLGGFAFVAYPAEREVFLTLARGRRIVHSTGFQPASGSNSVIAVTVSFVLFPKSFCSSTPSWLMMNGWVPVAAPQHSLPTTSPPRQATHSKAKTESTAFACRPAFYLTFSHTTVHDATSG
jgi:hypothetical protein